VSSSLNRFLTADVASSGTSLVKVSTRAVLDGAGLLRRVRTGSGSGVPSATLTRSIACKSSAKHKCLHMYNQQ